MTLLLSDRMVITNNPGVLHPLNEVINSFIDNMDIYRQNTTLISLCKDVFNLPFSNKLAYTISLGILIK